MPPKYFSLRWETTADQWWFASPIDCAAANGYYDLVRHLIQIDHNLLFKLTSLARIRRLEAVWDDDGHRGFAASSRSKVARNLLRDCETLGGRNSLIGAGYGGWLLYTAAAAGDLPFLRELLGRDPLLVFGEGEYGLTDIFYAAARGGSREVFAAVLDSCLSAMKGRREDIPPDFRWEVMNRAAHAAARGGSLGVLTELLRDGSAVLAYRDNLGSTVLHSAAGRGQVEVVKSLISSYSDVIVSSVDNQGNTALHVAAYRGHLSTVEALVTSPASVYSKNNSGDTFLHMVIAGFRTPSFRQLNRQIDLLRKVLDTEFVRTDDIINLQNNEGRTPLHVAVLENIQFEVLELIVSVNYIDLNIPDEEGNTPLDLLSKKPRSASTEILTKRLISAGGVLGNSRVNDFVSVSVSNSRLHGMGSPGTSFRTRDEEILLNAGIEDTREVLSGGVIPELVNYSGEIEIKAPKYENLGSGSDSTSSKVSRDPLKKFLRWLGRRKKNTNESDFEEDKLSFKSYSRFSGSDSPVPLRRKFSRILSSPGNKRILSLQGNLPSPSAKKKFLARDARPVRPKSNLGSPCSAYSYSESSWFNLESASVGPSSLSQSPEKFMVGRKHGSFNLRSMNNYLCLGSHGRAVEGLIESSPCQDRRSVTSCSM